MEPPPLNRLVQRLIALRADGIHITLLAVCPNSDAVLEAAVKVAAESAMPMLFAATLNQVDLDGGYTGWTPQAFVARIHAFAEKYRCAVPLYPCLDHGGPWLKDAHARAGLSLAATMSAVKTTLKACLEAGYALLHIDPTVARDLPPGRPLAIDTVIAHTVELIAYAETTRRALNMPPVAYEVGTEEVHGGLADMETFDRFLEGLRAGLSAAGLAHVWPCFIVGKVGTDLHTMDFDAEVAARLYARVAPLGSLIKGHYTDWVANPAAYPAAGMGGANVGPEFTMTEAAALFELSAREPASATPAHFKEALKAAVLASGRWQKWLLAGEIGCVFDDLAPERQDWLVGTGARYVWTDAPVMAARAQLYANLCNTLPDPHAFVVKRIAEDIQHYGEAFNLVDSLSILG